VEEAMKHEVHGTPSAVLVRAHLAGKQVRAHFNYTGEPYGIWRSRAGATYITSQDSRGRPWVMPTAAPPDNWLLPPAALRLASLVRLFSHHYRNSWTPAEEAAVNALTLGLPAYWGTATHSNVLASDVLLTANRMGAKFALAKHARPDWPSPAAHRPALLATLIPLNQPARDELGRLREALR